MHRDPFKPKLPGEVQDGRDDLPAETGTAPAGNDIDALQVTRRPVGRLWRRYPWNNGPLPPQVGDNT